MSEHEALVKVIYQIAIMCVLCLTAFAAGRTKYLPENTGHILSRVVIKLTAPILIVTTMANYNFTKSMVKDMTFIYISGVIFILYAFSISILVSKMLKLEGSRANVYKMLSMFGNVMYLAYPLMMSLYGDKGIIYAVFYNLANDSVLWTLGIFLVNRHQKSNKGITSNLKQLINGNTISFLIGITCVITNFKGIVEGSNQYVKNTYVFIMDTFQPLGKTTSVLSMIFIGLILSQVRFDSMKDILKRYPLLIMCFFKLIFVPVTALIVLNMLGGMVDHFVKSIIVLQLGMPCGTIIAALTSQYDSDYSFATEGVFFSTIIGAATLPLMVHLI